MKKEWGNKVGDFIYRWIINIVQVIVAIAIINVGMQAVWWFFDSEEYYDIFGHTWMSDTLSRCDSLLVELEADWECIDSPACTMTRDELVGHEKRLAKIALHCEVSDE